MNAPIPYLDSEPGVLAHLALAEAVRLLAESVTVLTPVMKPADAQHVRQSLQTGGGYSVSLSVKPGKPHTVRLWSVPKHGTRRQVLEVELPADESGAKTP